MGLLVMPRPLGSSVCPQETRDFSLCLHLWQRYDPLTPPLGLQAYQYLHIIHVPFAHVFTGKWPLLSTESFCVVAAELVKASPTARPVKHFQAPKGWMCLPGLAVLLAELHIPGVLKIISRGRGSWQDGPNIAQRVIGLCVNNVRKSLLLGLWIRATKSRWM